VLRAKRNRIDGVATSALVWLLLWVAPLSAQTRFFRDGFNDPSRGWTLERGQCKATILAHQRNAHVVAEGAASEQLVFSTHQLEPPAQLIYPVPEALVFDELTASLAIQTSLQGVRIGVRLRFPHQIDPRTRQPLSVDLLGEATNQVGEWQRIACRTSDTAVADRIVRLRHQLRGAEGSATFDEREAYVDAVVVYFELQPGRTALFLDDLQFGPVVTPMNGESHDIKGDADDVPKILVRDDQLLVNDAPFVPLIAPYHGEQVDALVEAGFNVVWVPRLDDVPLLRALHEEGLYVMAEPPRLIVDEGAVAAGTSALMPFTDEMNPVLFWNCGTRIDADDIETIAAWVELVRDADHNRARPIVADVVGREREFHRHLDLLGSSRHPLHTTMNFRDYIEYLRQKRKHALPDKPSFTHVQTEPALANLNANADGSQPPLVEPEQIWLQVYAALAAGYKGISYWSYDPFTGDAENTTERRLAIALCNERIRLLEDWLATGKVVEVVAARLGDDAAAQSDEIQVAVIRSRFGLLLLPVWYESQAQFQPGPMFARDLTFVVSPFGDNILGWEVTTTGVTPLSQQQMQRMSGGFRIHLEDFDQHTMILLASDPETIEPIRTKVLTEREPNARRWIDLAAAKWDRVQRVHQELAALAPPVRNGDLLLSEAKRQIELAEDDFAQGRFDDARRSARLGMYLTRTLQRRHWDKAAGSLSSPVSSPHTICFQTLPDHWRMLARIGRSRQRENLLRSGGFEDADTLFASGWEHKQTNDRSVRPWAELFGESAEGDYCLRLLAGSADHSIPVRELDEPPVRFISPPISVYAGQTIMITGQLLVASNLTGNTDGLMIYESTKGTVGGIRWHDASQRGEWERFQLIREIRQSGEMRISIELRALGDVRIDDLQVFALDSR